MVGISKNIIAKLPAPQLVSSIIEQAIGRGATYIHFEPQSDILSVRFRINGLLTDIEQLPKKRLGSILSRIKQLANIDSNDRFNFQEGRFKYSLGDIAYSLRVSLVPTVNGEKIVINILNESMSPPSLEELGLWGHSLKLTQESLLADSGMILLSGLSGSGQSTSMYSFINYVRENRQIGVSTIENLVEFRLNGVSQVEVSQKSNLTFYNALSAILKTDSNLIMVSHLQDHATAELALTAATQRKLILSGLIAKKTTGAFNMLEYLDVHPHLLARGLSLIVSQDLSKKLCPDCRIKLKPSKELVDEVSSCFGLSPSRIKHLHGLGVEYTKQKDDSKTSTKDLSITEGRIKWVWGANPKGCDKCFHSGYRGRIGVFEVIKFNPSLEKLLVSMAASKIIYLQAIKEGAVPFIDDLAVKTFAGDISIEESIRLSLEGV